MERDAILIIDDNPMNVKLVAALLKHAHYTPYMAANAEDALATLQTLRPRLILMDIQLPGMDGLALTRRLKANVATRDILIVALTAYAMKGDAEKIMAAGCDGYIAKPIDIGEFWDEIARYLAPMLPPMSEQQALFAEQ